MAEFPCGISSGTSSLGGAACWFGLETTLLSENPGREKIVRRFLITARIWSSGGSLLSLDQKKGTNLLRFWPRHLLSSGDSMKRLCWPCMVSVMCVCNQGSDRQATKRENNVSEISYIHHCIFDAVNQHNTSLYLSSTAA